MVGLVMALGRVPGSGGCGGQAVPAGADRLEQVVAGGPQVQFGVGLAVAVVQVGAEPGEHLGEDRLDDPGSLLVAGLAIRGGELGGHLLPGSMALRGCLPSFSRPAWRASLVTATCRSPSQGAVKLASLAYPASNKIAPIGPLIPAPSVARPLASSGCMAALPAGLGQAVMA